MKVSRRNRFFSQKIAPFLKGYASFIDIGGGRGSMARILSAITQQSFAVADLKDWVSDKGYKFIQVGQDNRIDAQTDSFDIAILMFVLHHIPEYRDQVKLIKEAVRVANQRIIIIEDTPNNVFQKMTNCFWDYILNLFQGVKTPFTFRSTEEWLKVFQQLGLNVVSQEVFPSGGLTLGGYQHTMYVLDIR